MSSKNPFLLFLHVYISLQLNTCGPTVSIACLFRIRTFINHSAARTVYQHVLDEWKYHYI